MKITEGNIKRCGVNPEPVTTKPVGFVPPGQGATSPPVNAPNYSEWLDATLRAVAVRFGVAYEELIRDYPRPHAPRTLADECPQCHGYSEVLRVVRPRVALKRRRRCLTCGHRWNTREVPE
jgi:hypothetical protein